MEFWEAVNKVKEKHPEEWTWAEWLSVIDLSDGICHHPIQYRLAVNMARNSDGVLAKWVDKEKVLDIPWLVKELKNIIILMLTILKLSIQSLHTVRYVKLSAQHRQ